MDGRGNVYVLLVFLGYLGPREKRVRIVGDGGGSGGGGRGEGLSERGGGVLVSRVDAQLEFCISASLQIIQMYVNIRYNNRFPLSEKEA